MGTEAQPELPGMADELCRQRDQFLHDRAHPPALGRMAHRRTRAHQAGQPDPAQDVVVEGASGHDQGVGVELARRLRIPAQRDRSFRLNVTDSGG